MHVWSLISVICLQCRQEESQAAEDPDRVPHVSTEAYQGMSSFCLAGRLSRAGEIYCQDCYLETPSHILVISTLLTTSRPLHRLPHQQELTKF